MNREKKIKRSLELYKQENARQATIIHIFKRRTWYLAITIVCIILIPFSLVYDFPQNINDILFSIFTGALIPLVTSFPTNSTYIDIFKQEYNDLLYYLNELGQTYKEARSDANRLITKFEELKQDPNFSCSKPELIPYISKFIQSNTPPTSLSSIHIVDCESNLNIASLISHATHRVYLLGTDFTNRLSNYTEAITTACINGAETKILSIHPDNVFLKTRYSEIGWPNHSTFRNRICNSNEQLKALKRNISFLNSNANIEIRLFLSQPTVLLYVIDDLLIISHILCSKEEKTASNGVQICCNLKTHPKAELDFVSKHFLTTWNNATDILACPISHPYSAKTFFSLDTNHRLRQYEFFPSSQKTIISPFLIKTLSCLENLCSLLKQHYSKLSVPIIGIAVSFLALITGHITLYYSHASIATSIINTALGLFTGSILSIIDYTCDTIQRQQEKKSALIDPEETSNHFGYLLDECFYPGFSTTVGIQFHANRNNVHIKELIDKSSERIWFYTTNYEFFDDPNILAALKRKRNCTDIRFLMLDPRSLFIHTRAPELHKNSANAFCQEVYNNLLKLYKDFEASTHIQIRHSINSPTLMMYLFDDTLVISHILCQDPNTSERARNQVHFSFNLKFPTIKHCTSDYINHFLYLWNNTPISERHPIAAFDITNSIMSIEKGRVVNVDSTLQPFEVPD